MIFGEYVILKKLFIFRQKHFTGIVQRRLDYIFVSNSLQESVKKNRNSKCFIIRSFPVFCSFVNNDTFVRGLGVWKLHNALLFSTDLEKKLKSHTEIVKANFQEKPFFSDHTKWKFLKYEMRKLSISFSNI